MSEIIDTASKDIKLFIDEPLRQFAYQAVDFFLKENDAVKTNQLQSIPGVISGGGLAALKKMVDSQREKNSKAKNKAFWNFLHQHLFVSEMQKDTAYSFHHFLRKQSFIQPHLKYTTTAANKKQRSQMNKQNKNTIDNVMDQLLSVYFEHFNCHYFYQTQGAA
jgi:hypothetical protein